MVISGQVTNLTIRSAVSENPVLHANLTVLCFIEAELLPIEVLHYGVTGIWIFDLFCCRDLDPVTFIYELRSYSLETYQGSENELPMSRVSKVIVCQTDRQTDALEIIYHAASRVVKSPVLQVAHKNQICPM